MADVSDLIRRLREAVLTDLPEQSPRTTLLREAAEALERMGANASLTIDDVNWARCEGIREGWYAAMEAAAKHF